MKLGWKAKGRKKEQGLNKEEADYQSEIDRRIHIGEILWRSEHGAVNFRLAAKTFYRPDWLVLNAAMELEVHEYKGGWFAQDNKSRTKIAAEIYPLRFIIVRQLTKEKGEDKEVWRARKAATPWIFEEV